MYEPGKIHNTIKEMKRLNISILGISEMRWPGSGKVTVDDHIVYYSGEDSSKHKNGVAIVMAKETDKGVKNVVPFSDRILMVQIQSTTINVNILQVYAPTQDYEQEEIEKFYHDLEKVLAPTKKHDLNIIMGDFNAKIGEGEQEDIIGKYGLGIRNERGDMLASFCVEKQLVITNTIFKLPKRRLYTWKSPADTPERVVRN